MAKMVYATAGSQADPVSVTVVINNVGERDRLTPALARSAARIAFGHTLGVTVSDRRDAYRLTRWGARKIEVAFELDNSDL